MTTLVVCLDRTDDVGRKTGLRSPVVGWEAVRALVTDVGLADPEDSGVNSLLETLRIGRELREQGEEVVVGVVSGDRESMVSADRAVAGQLDDLIAEHDPDSAVVIIDSAEDERLVPIVESRVRVDSVDRVVVRQARDIESTYYLLKQFLADEELRQTVLVPIGLTLLVFPMLAWFVGPAEGAAAITTVIGVFLLYKGFNVDDLVTGLGRRVRESLYSGQVSVVTYVVAVGLTLVGFFVGGLGVSSLEETSGMLIPAMRFTHDSVPWLAMAALTASAGRLLDEVIREEPIRSSFVNLPFIVVAVGMVVRGFSAYFLQQQDVIGPLSVAAVEQGALSVDSFTLTAGERLAVFVLSAIVVSLVGTWIASSVGGSPEEEPAAELANAGPELPDAPSERAGEARPRTDRDLERADPPLEPTDPERTDGGSAADGDDAE